MSEIKVNSIKGVAASAAAITVNNTDGTCTANLTNRTNKNLIINGAMQVAQRGTSSTTNGYQTVDRFNVLIGGVDEQPTQAQVDVASGTTPYTLGFRKALKLTNGNNTSGAGATDYLGIYQAIEAQNIATSGWNYLSSSSFITLSFWVKSSVAQVFSGSVGTSDGTAYYWKFDTPSLSANTWTKVTKTVFGNSNLTINNDVGVGLGFRLYGFLGTSYTSSNSNTGTWNSGGNQYANDMTSTWWTTNDATLEITGLQIEVGSVATDFEHRTFAQELALCQRYYYLLKEDTFAFHYRNDYRMVQVQFPQQMRATPTVTGTYEPTSGWSSYQANNTQVTLFVQTADSVQANNYVRELRLDSEL